MSQSNFQQSNPAPNFSQIFEIFKKRIFSFFGIFGLFVVLGLIYVFTARPVYQSDSIILIGTPTSDQFAGKNKQFEEVDPTESESYKTQYALLQSRSLIKRPWSRQKKRWSNTELIKNADRASLRKIIADLKQ